VPRRPTTSQSVVLYTLYFISYTLYFILILCTFFNDQPERARATWAVARRAVGMQATTQFGPRPLPGAEWRMILGIPDSAGWKPRNTTCAVWLARAFGTCTRDNLWLLSGSLWHRRCISVKASELASEFRHHTGREVDIAGREARVWFHFQCV